MRETERSKALWALDDPGQAEGNDDQEVLMRTVRIAIVAVAVGAGIVLAGLPAAAATGHVSRATAVAPSTCPPRNSPGFCGG